MSSTASVYIKGYEIASSTNYLDSSILTLFQESDLVVEILKKKGDKVKEARAFFQNTLSNLLDRLKVIGFSKSVYYNLYHDVLQHEIDELESIAKRLKGVTKKEINLEIKALKKSSLEIFNQALKHIIDNKIYSYKYEGEYKNTYPVLHYLIRKGIFGHPSINSFHDLVFTLGEIYDPESIVSYDFSDLIDYEYFENSVYSVYQESFDSESCGYKQGEKIIILTEGSSDVNILSQSIEILYPHLKNYYYFMDFNSSNASGSTGALVNTIKAFIGAGIKNRVIALFDNDTAARDALSSIDGVDIPENIVILHLPHLDFAESYPTLGPTGDAVIDINSLACSIELYLGKDVIQENGNFIPIQWTGYVAKMKAYQGEIVKKQEVQKKYFQQLGDIRNGKFRIDEKDFSGIKLIFEMIFEAFENDGASVEEIFQWLFEK